MYDTLIVFLKDITIFNYLKLIYNYNLQINLCVLLYRISQSRMCYIF